MESILTNQAGYWDAEGAGKTFTLPVDAELLAQRLRPDSRILDYGCGYGRVMAQLWESGYRHLCGVDTSRALIERGRRELPHLPAESLRWFQPPRLPFADASFDAALLIAVLTAIPEDDAQRAVMGELHRVLHPGGILYLSDFWLQTDSRNLERYAQWAAKYGQHGVFELPEGAVLRHHSREWITTLTAGWETLAMTDLQVQTMHGHPATAFRWLLRKPWMGNGSGEAMA